MTSSSRLKFDDTYLGRKIRASAAELMPAAQKCLSDLQGATCIGADYTAWYDWPRRRGFKLADELKEFRENLVATYDLVVVVGIGGSYAGTKAVVDALSHRYAAVLTGHAGAGSRVHDSKKQVVYAGHNLSESELIELMDLLDKRQPLINVISKSGTTTEPSVAFRVLQRYVEKRFGEEEANSRIIAITDENSGALRELSTEKKYRTFVVPGDVGGRYSVLTAVGLVPLMLAGFSVSDLLEGADELFAELAGNPEGEQLLKANPDQNHQDAARIDPGDSNVTSNEGMSGVMSENTRSMLGGDEAVLLKQVKAYNHPVLRYAAARKAAWDHGKRIEILAYGEPKAAALVEWWKQLFGESEGKDGLGLYPSALNCTTDLHSMGQYVQDGCRNLFETFLHFGRLGTHQSDSAGSSVAGATNIERRMRVPEMSRNLDGLRYLENKYVSEINDAAMTGTRIAHFDGGVPCLELSLPSLDERNLGYLIAFYETSCAISAALLGVNPFDQPGVEDYKKNLFGLLGKPGYADLEKKLRMRVEADQKANL